MTDHWLWVIIAALANYKASHMLSQEGDDGPFDIFKKLRDRVGTGNWVGKGLHCFSCTSFWGALVASLLLSITYVIPVHMFILQWGAVATLAFMVWRYFG